MFCSKNCTVLKLIEKGKARPLAFATNPLKASFLLLNMSAAYCVSKYGGDSEL